MISSSLAMARAISAARAGPAERSTAWAGGSFNRR
jgi:hypothetical protein